MVMSLLNFSVDVPGSQGPVQKRVMFQLPMISNMEMSVIF